MTFISAEPQDEVLGPLAAGRPSLWSHVKTATEATLYDLPMANIQRAIDLQDAGNNWRHDDLLDPSQANDMFGIPGQVKFDKPVTYEKARLINQFKKDELERYQLLELGNDTVGRKAAYFAAGFVAQAFDPINLAVNFMPIVGEARFAKLVQQFGLTKARVLAGALEVGVGNAMVEPFAYLSKAVGEQNEYGLQQTVANMAIGTLFGTTLRVGGGAVKDRFFGKYSPEQILTSIKAKDTKLALDATQRRLIKEADEATTIAGYMKGTQEYDTAFIEQLAIRTEMHKPELEMLQSNLRSLDPSYHRAAFEEGLNNLLNDEPFVGPAIIHQLQAMDDIRIAMKRSWSRVQEEVKQTPVELPKQDVDLNVTQVGDTVKIEYKNTLIHMTDDVESIHLNIKDQGDVEDLQGIVYGKAVDALEGNKELYIDGAHLDREALQLFVNGTDAVKNQIKIPEPQRLDSVDIKPVESNTEFVSRTAPEKITEQLTKQNEILSNELITTKAGKPFASENTARRKLAKMENKQDYEVVPQDDGFVIKKKGAGQEVDAVVDQVSQDYRAEFEDSIAGLPDEIQQQLLDDFDAVNHLKDEQNGINAAIDCLLENLL